MASLFANIPAELPDELCEQILCSGRLRIERIVSKGQCSPEQGWYDQDQHEWVLLVKGAAVLEFEQDGKQLTLTDGMHLNIPAHCRHRVAWTDPAQETIWLAVFY
ncbi:cupin [Marinobacterium sp. CAU 1594]|nr:cupin [Marinobacterium arenosum]